MRRHLVLTRQPPVALVGLRPPLPFMGCGHFGLANAFLQQHGCDADCLVSESSAFELCVHADNFMA